MKRYTEEELIDEINSLSNQVCYWNERCLLAEKINEEAPISDFNPIEYQDAINAYNKFINENPEEQETLIYVKDSFVKPS